ncbi:MAG: hypothetical protein WAT79_16435 [Saprospiraceae bacterium]
MFTGFLFSCHQDDVKKVGVNEGANLENRTVEPCEPLDSEQMPCVKDTQLWFLQLQLFDTCTFLFETEVYDCGNLRYYFGNYKIILHGCDSIDTWINNCTSSGGTYASCMALLNAQIMEALALKIATTENPPSPNISVYFFNAVCNQYCLYEMYDPRADKYYNVFDKLRCSNACCIHTYQLKKVNGEWIIFDSEIEQYNGIGCAFAQQAESCESGAIYTSDCIHECE